MKRAPRRSEEGMMSHSWNCPTDWEAEREARYAAERDRERGWGRSYSDPYDCHHSNEAYRREYDDAYRRSEEQAAEERAAQRRAEARRYEEEMEMEYYRQAAEENEMARAQEAEYYEAMERQRWEDEQATLLKPNVETETP